MSTGQGRVKQRAYTYLGIFAGLTPHWQLIHSILKNSEDDHTQIRLVDANSGLSVRPPPHPVLSRFNQAHPPDRALSYVSCFTGRTHVRRAQNLRHATSGSIQTVVHAQPPP